MPPRVHAIDPVLPVRDVRAAAAFYAQLGFALVADFPPQYAIVQRDAAHLHLRCAAGELKEGENPAGIYIYVEDVRAFYAELIARGVKTLGEPRPQAWGVDFALSDPDGNLVRIGEVDGR